MNTTFYPNNDYRVYLAHHGIKGQKWGDRNGPPYPLGPNNHSASEKKAGWRQSLQTSSSQKTNAPKKKSSSSGLYLTDREKKLLKIGATVAITALAVYGGYKLYQHYNLKPEIELGLFSKINGVESERKRLKNCNPKFSYSNTSYNCNCGNTVIANELRSRGIDIQAGPNKTGMTFSQLGSYFTGLHSGSFCDPDIRVPELSATIRSRMQWGFISMSDRPAVRKRGIEVRSQLNAQLSAAFPSGSRGAMFVPAETGSHWISWENKDGKIHLMNPQCPGVDLDMFLGGYKYWPNVSAASISAIRLDDVSINKDAIKQAVVDPHVSSRHADFNSKVVNGKDFVIKTWK